MFTSWRLRDVLRTIVRLSITLKTMSIKRLHRFIAVCIVAFTAVCATFSASAQTGEKTLGVGAGIATHNNGGYMDLYFQYTVAPHVRIAPEIGYVFRNEGETGFEVSADVHFPFRIAKGFNVYPLVGLTLNNWDHKHGDGYTRFGGDFGAGFDIYLTSNFKLSLQGKYSLMNDCSGGFFNVGFGYVF